MSDAEAPDPATARAALQATKQQMLGDLLTAAAQVRRRALQLLEIEAPLAQLEE